MLKIIPIPSSASCQLSDTEIRASSHITLLGIVSSSPRNHPTTLIEEKTIHNAAFPVAGLKVELLVIRPT